MANHTGDLGALAGDVAYLPTAAACGRIRGDLLNLTALVCGNRFGRRLVRPGGCRYDLEDPRRSRLAESLARATDEAMEACEWLWASHSARSRFDGIGTVTEDQARQIGLVGVAARASGLKLDVRRDHPAGWYRSTQVPVAVCPAGDVFSRARVRWLELQSSAACIQELLAAPPRGPVIADPSSPRPDRLALALVEGWRGEVCHVALTDRNGCFLAYKIVDPSFHNWTGLALAMRRQAIADFPVCNKSFNLSYCGFDL
jgi:Ni,Fe-hydrogenase III large subunit